MRIGLPRMSVAGLARRATRLAAPILAIVLVLPSVARGQDLPGWLAALGSGSDRLALFALNRANPPGAEPVRMQLAWRTGGLHQGRRPQVVARAVSFRPILNYASNFNGGIPGDSIRLAGLEFIVDENSRARSGVVYGATLSGGIAASYRPGSLLRFSASGTAQALAGSKLARAEVGLGLCVQHYLTGWTWLDGCASVAQSWRNYDSKVVQRQYSLGPTTIFHAAGMDQQVSLSLTRLGLNADSQNGIAANWLGAVPELGALGLGLRWNERMQGENMILRGASLRLRRPVSGRLVEFGLTYDETGGAKVFGQERKDRIVAGMLGLPLNETLRIYAIVGRRNSTISAYSGNFGKIDFQLAQF